MREWSLCWLSASGVGGRGHGGVASSFWAHRRAGRWSPCLRRVDSPRDFGWSSPSCAVWWWVFGVAGGMPSGSTSFGVERRDRAVCFAARHQSRRVDRSLLKSSSPRLATAPAARRWPPRSFPTAALSAATAEGTFPDGVAIPRVSSGIPAAIPGRRAARVSVIEVVGTHLPFARAENAHREALHADS